MIVRIAAALAGTLLLTGAVASAMPRTMVIPLRAENKSGEHGTARLMQLPNGLQVVINLTGAPAAPQPAHIHNGTCQKLNPAPLVPLHNVVNGYSKTFLPGKKMSQYMGTTAINVHKSLTDIPTYVACGAIK